ncbi:MAG: S8 family serine peptidase [Clostridia bacterium]|nr:S8 family serine peptidase [Clostridia bacterium]
MKKTKIINKIVGLILVTSLLVFSLNTVAYAYDYFIEKCELKISEDLTVAMKSVEKDQKISVAIWCEEADLTKIENDVFNEMNLTKEDLLDIVNSDIAKDEQIEMMQEFVARKRKLIKNVYDEKNLAISKLFDEDVSIEYVDSYSPIVIATANVDDIEKLSRKSFVENMYISDCESSSELDVSRKVVRANTMQELESVLGYSGEGIKIGVLESVQSGIPDNSMLGLPDSRFFTESGVPQSTHKHASIVSMIIASQGLNGNAVGIAPDVSLYATWDCTGGSFIQRAKWLLNSGVNIINVSLGYTGAFNSYNTYGIFDQYIDYVTATSNVLFVVSAGNESILGVTSPGMAYSAITVANTDDKNTKSISDDTLADNSSHCNELEISIASKPDISAPGTNIYTTEYGNDSGTSNSAAHVTGIAALLCDQDPLLLYSPLAIKAILTAGVSTSNHAYVPSDRMLTTNIFVPASSYIQYGAGIVNCIGAASVVQNECYDFGYLSSNTSSTTYTISCTAGERKRVSLSFFHSNIKNVAGNVSFDFVDLDLEVYDLQGNKIEQSVTTNNTLEIVDFTAQNTGDYIIKIVRKTAIGSNVSFGIAWT